MRLAFAVAFVAAVPSLLSAEELLKDTEFTDGFRAFTSCEAWMEFPRLGECLAYQVAVPGSKITTWPDPPGQHVDTGKFWNLNEGLHVQDGKDLQIYKIETNGVLVLNDAQHLEIKSLNNGQVVHDVASNRHGTIRMYGNTKNELFNDATDNGPNWGTNTWPHLYIEQNFKKRVPLSRYSSLTFSLDATIQMLSEIRGWNHPYKNATFSLVVTLRETNAASNVLFLVLSPISNNPNDLDKRLGVDQWGQGLFRIGVCKSMSVKAGVANHYSIDLFYALKQANQLSSSVKDVTEYFVSSVSAGWELVGYYEFASTIANISLDGAVIKR